MGIGIHGEPGRERVALRTAREIAGYMAESILADLPYQRGDRVIAMVNGLGGTPLMELYLMYGELERVLQGRGIAVARRLVGNYMTSLEMAGCTFTLLRADDELLALWDEPVLTPALRWGL
jgi:dihydroxyacetone kinase-like protein